METRRKTHADRLREKVEEVKRAVDECGAIDCPSDTAHKVAECAVRTGRAMEAKRKGR